MAEEDNLPSNGTTSAATSKNTSGPGADSSVVTKIGPGMLRLICHQCGACSPAVFSHAGPEEAAKSDSNAASKGSDKTPKDGAVSNGDDASKSADGKKQKQRTRVGRYTKSEGGDETIVDEADWSAPPDPSKDGEFAITIKHERRTDIWGHIYMDFEQLSLVSPALVGAVRSVIRYFPGIGLEGSQISLKSPYAPLFFYYDDVCKSGEENPDSDWKEDLEALKLFYTKWVKPGHDRIRRHLKDGLVLYDDLWSIFRPGEIIYTLDEAGEPCFHVVIATEFREPDSWESDSFSIRRFPRLSVDMWRVSWDSATGLFQRLSVTRSIRSFSGSRLINSLPFYPLVYYKGGSAEEIQSLKNTLQDRGRKWKDLVSQQPSCQYYDGPARNYSQLETQHLDERVVIDGSAGASLLRNGETGRGVPDGDYVGMVGGQGESRQIEYERSVVGTGLDPEHMSFDDFPPDESFSDLHAQLCPSSVICYAIKSREWFRISISLIKDVDWATDALEHLVLERRMKDMLVALVEQHRNNRDKVISDVIKSKGKGLIIVLHGPPGVGKTLTAETVAEYTQKPLYPINIGELTSEESVVEKLQKHFSRASRWDAVLLLDEADVLLEKRSYEDLHRNGIVSVFLRMLEYYEGILFLTTNRLATMDMAFQSRIHIAIRYPDLIPETRRRIWEKFIQRIDSKEIQGKRELMDHLDDLEKWPLNGRQIRNILATAESLALSTSRRRGALRYSQVEEVADETMRFQDFFEEGPKERKSQLGEISSRQFQERRVRIMR